MKSQTRAWIIFTLLFVLWGTLPASPFVYFADLIRETGDFFFARQFLPPAWQSVLIYLLFTLFFVSFLLIGRSKSQVYLAGICALAGMVHHLILCLRTQQLYAVSPAIAVGLALALLFLLIKPQAPAFWLSDAFIMALPVYLLYDGLLSPLFRLLEWSFDLLAPFMPVPSSSLVSSLDGLLGIPAVFWTILPVAAALSPMIWLTAKRRKG